MRPDLFPRMFAALGLLVLAGCGILDLLCAGREPPPNPAAPTGAARAMVSADAAATDLPDVFAVVDLLQAYGRDHFNRRWASYHAVFHGYATGDLIRDEAIYRLRALAEMTAPPPYVEGK